MSAGTLTLTNNSAAVRGSGTAFNNELVAGDFIVAKVGGITYTLPIKTVGSDTQVVLVSKYPGPSLAGIAWQSVPRESQNQVTAELVAQTTAALRGLNYDKQNWQAVFSASGDITVMLPDGSTFTGPSWQSIKDTLALIDIDAVTALANQVRADAQQVATDKPIIIQAKTDAETAKTASETAQGKAGTAQQKSEAAQGKSETAQAAAEASATAAAASAAEAKTSETNAAESKRLAEAARDAANSSAGIYQDTTSGLAGTATGGYFSVLSPLDDEVLILYRNDSGIATEVKRYPSSAGVENTRASMIEVAASLVLTQSIIAAHHAFL